MGCVPPEGSAEGGADEPEPVVAAPVVPLFVLVACPPDGWVWPGSADVCVLPPVDPEDVWLSPVDPGEDWLLASEDPLLDGAGCSAVVPVSVAVVSSERATVPDSGLRVRVTATSTDTAERRRRRDRAEVSLVRFGSTESLIWLLRW